MNSKKKAFTNYHAELNKDEKKMQVQLNRIKKYCSVTRVIVHTQMNFRKNLRQKRNNIFEIQTNGEKDIAEKIESVKKHFEQEIS